MVRTSVVVLTVKVLSVLVVVFELLDESSFFAQEMRVRLKNADRRIKIIFFIF